MKLACSAASYFFLGINRGQEKLKCNLQGSLQNVSAQRMCEQDERDRRHSTVARCYTQNSNVVSSAAHSSHFIVKRSPEKGDNND